MKMQIHASFREISWWKVISPFLIFINFFPKSRLRCFRLRAAQMEWNFLSFFLFLSAPFCSSMFSCLHALLAHVGNLTYSFLFVPQANRSFFSDTWGPRPWVQTSFWQCSGMVIVGYSFAVAAVFDCFSCLSLPHTGLCPLLSSWRRQRRSQLGAG